MIFVNGQLISSFNRKEADFYKRSYTNSIDLMKPPYHPHYQICCFGAQESIITLVLGPVLSSHGLNLRKDSPQGAITSITYTSYSR